MSPLREAAVLTLPDSGLHGASPSSTPASAPATLPPPGLCTSAPLPPELLPQTSTWLVPSLPSGLGPKLPSRGSLPWPPYLDSSFSLSSTPPFLKVLSPWHFLLEHARTLVLIVCLAPQGCAPRRLGLLSGCLEETDCSKASLARRASILPSDSPESSPRARRGADAHIPLHCRAQVPGTGCVSARGFDRGARRGLHSPLQLYQERSHVWNPLNSVSSSPWVLNWEQKGYGGHLQEPHQS